MTDLRRTRATWERLGQADPLWAVLSTPGRRDGAWDIPYFLETGRIDLTEVLRLMGPVGATFGRRVLDFGCGVGRLTQVLTEHAEQAVGVDIAESMIRLAHELNQVGERAEFVHSDSDRLPFDDDSFDGALSLMVLQHLPPRLALHSMLELVRVVRPGGTLALQIPSHPLIPTALPAEACRAEITVLDAPATLTGSTAGVVRAAVRNASPRRWPVGQSIRLANHWRSDGAVVLADDGRCELPHALAPGESVELELRVSAPDAPGDYRLELDVVQEFVAWWAELGSPTTSLDVTVTSAAVAEPEPEPVAGESVEQPEPAESAQAKESGEVEAGEPAIRDSAIEMHPMHVGFVRSFFEQLGCAVLAVGEDDLAGPGWSSYTYVIQVG